MATYHTLESFGSAFFASKGGHNPVASRIVKREAKTISEDIRRGKYNHLLKTCGITGRKSGNIKPAEVKLSKDGGFDVVRMLVHRDVNVGERTDSGRTVLSINRDKRLRASIKWRAGANGKPMAYVQVYRKAK